MVKRYDLLDTLIQVTKPKSICEIGVHKGKRAKRMCMVGLKFHDKITYEGYDLWEDLTNSNKVFHGKGPSTKKDVIQQLKEIKNLNYNLIAGDTLKTLPNKYFDFVFLDGDHRDFAIQRDYERIRDSETIVFDDYYIPIIDGVGCNTVEISNKRKFLSLGGDKLGPNHLFSKQTEIKFMIVTSNKDLIYYLESNKFKEL